MEENDGVSGDGENGIGEIEISIRERVKVEADPMASRLRNEESVGGIGRENSGGEKKRQ